MVAKKIQTRDPDATRLRILQAAKIEFARKGLGGARVDDIAARAKTNKRMLYHYFGNKDDLFRITLEHAYADFREAEANMELQRDDPITAMRRLVTFTWNYYLANPEFITLINSENLHKAKHLKVSKRTPELSRPFVQRMQDLLTRGTAQNLFRPNLDAMQVNFTIAAIGYYYLTNRYTGALVYERDLMTTEALVARLDFNIQTILRMVCTLATLQNLDRKGET